MRVILLFHVIIQHFIWPKTILVIHGLTVFEPSAAVGEFAFLPNKANLRLFFFLLGFGLQKRVA